MREQGNATRKEVLEAQQEIFNNEIRRLERNKK